MADNKFDLADYGINQAGNTDIQEELAAYVKRAFSDAQTHRRSIGIDSRMLRNLRCNKCEYQPEELALLEPYNNVYMGIGALKARAAESWITDIILNNLEKPWTIQPTPEPELRNEQKDEVVEQLLNELPTIQGTAALEDRARQLKSVQSKIAFQKAEEATKRMETRISDQMGEAEWTDVFGQFVADLTQQPTALIRGPFVVGKKTATWDGSDYKTIDKSIPICRTVSPFDAFPAPDASTPNDGRYFIERFKCGRDKLYALIGVKGFNGGNIRQVLEEYPNGYSLDVFGDAERQRLEDKTPDDISLVGNQLKNLDILIYNGVVEGEKLVDHGVVVPDKQGSYECEVWVVGDYVIRAILNPNPAGRRPIYGTSYRKIRGSFWGQSVIDLVYDINRVCNAAARSMVKNMGYSAGPIGEADSSRVAETQSPTSITPYEIKLVGPDQTGTGGKAYHFHNIQSVAPHLMDIFDRYLKYADDISGIPAYILGNPQVAGAGRTLGGLSMLMGNAAKGIKQVQLNIDRDVIAPLVTGYYVYNMQTSKDESIKADCLVVARGATGLLQKELAQTRTIEIIQLLSPYIQIWDQLPEGIKVLLREVIKTTGLPVDDIIPDPNKDRESLNLLKLLSGGEGIGNVPLPSDSIAGAVGPGGGGNLPPQSMPPVQPFNGPPVPVNMPQGA